MKNVRIIKEEKAPVWIRPRRETRPGQDQTSWTRAPPEHSLNFLEVMLVTTELLSHLFSISTDLTDVTLVSDDIYWRLDWCSLAIEDADDDDDNDDNDDNDSLIDCQ